MVGAKQIILILALLSTSAIADGDLYKTSVRWPPKMTSPEECASRVYANITKNGFTEPYFNGVMISAHDEQHHIWIFWRCHSEKGILFLSIMTFDGFIGSADEILTKLSQEFTGLF